MNSIFKYITKILTILSILLIILPFSFIFKEGFNFATSIPYPKEILFAFKLSLISSLISSILCIIFTIHIVYFMFNTSQKLKSFLEYLFILPLGVPHIVSGIALITFFGHNHFGKFLEFFGIDFIYTPLGVILAQFFVNLPYSIKTFSNSYELIDKKLFFCARSLGLNESKIFFHVMIPMLKNQLFCIWMITLSRSLGEFGAVMMLVGVTRMKTETLATSIFLNMSTGDFNVASGVAVILMLISFITMSVFQHLINKGDFND